MPLLPVFLMKPSKIAPRACESTSRGRAGAVDDRREAVRPDEDRVRLAAEVEELEADVALGLLAAHLLAEVDPLRPTSGSVSTRSTVAPRMRKISRNALRAPGENASTPASTASRIAKPSASGRSGRRRAGRALEPGLEARRLGPGDLVAERAEAELELSHPLSSSCSRSRPSARDVRDLTVPRRSDSTSPVSSSPRSSR